VLAGVTDEDVEEARRFFPLHRRAVLESTEFGDVLARSDASQPARITSRDCSSPRTELPVLVQHHQLTAALRGAET